MRYFLYLILGIVSSNYITLSDRYTADPAPFVQGDRLYIYTSHDLADQVGWFMKDYSLMSTDDLANWRDEGIVFNIDNTSWGKYAWAQQVISGTDGKFYMYYPGMQSRAGQSRVFGIGVAVSSSVTGPFQDALGYPLHGGGGDDPTVFRDDDGQVYLCINDGGPLCGPLAPNMTGFLTPPVLLSPQLPNWFEAPWLSKWMATYYLSYMCQGDGLGNTSHYGWDICYGSCSGVSCSPLGPYVFRGSLMWNPPGDCGPPNQNCSNPRVATGENNHQGIVEFPLGSGHLYFAYHSRTLSKSRGAYLGYQRNVAIDRLYARGVGGTFPLPPGGLPWVMNDDVPGAGPGLLPVTSTPSWVRQLKYIDPYSIIPGTLSSLMSQGLDSEPCSEGGLNLGFIAGNATSTRGGLEFGGGGGGATAVVFRVATPLDGGFIELKGSGGEVLVRCPIKSTGGWQVWVNSSCALPTPLTGILQTLTLRFGSQNPPTPAWGGLLNLRYFTFTGGAAPPTPTLPPPVTVSLALKSASTGLFWESSTPSGQILPSSTTPVQFLLKDVEDGTYTLSLNGALLCVGGGGGWLTVNSSATEANPCTRFFLYGTTQGSYGLLGAQSGLFVAANTPSDPLAATQTDPRYAPSDGARHWLVEATV